MLFVWLCSLDIHCDSFLRLFVDAWSIVERFACMECSNDIVCCLDWNKMYLQVTKLCDLGIDDSVCSVGWAQRGTHLAVGTNNGKVQVINAFHN